MTTQLACDESGQGTPLVLIHAFPLTKEMWRPQADVLKTHCRLLVPDMRGFGASPAWAGEPSIDAMADDVAQLLDSRKIAEPAIVGGLSMGGYVALAFARKYPQRLRGLILADTRAEADNDEGKANRNKTMTFLETHPVSELIDQMMPKLVAETTAKERPNIVGEIRRIAAAQSQTGVRAAVQALRDRIDSTPFLAKTQVPTLVLVGADDSLTPPAMSEKMQSSIPNAELVKIANAGHLSNMEQPAAFADALIGFLKRCS